MNKYIYIIIIIIIIYIHYSYLYNNHNQRMENYDNILDIDIENYFNNYNKNFIELNDLYMYSSFTYNVHPNIKYILYSNNVVYYNLINNKKKNWELFDLIDNNKYEVYSIKFQPKTQTIIYYFNINNPSFLIQSWVYSEFTYYGNVNNKKIISICNSTSGVKDSFSINNSDIFNVNNNIILKNKSYYFFGFVGNPGHHLWNEISGLVNFLNYPNNITNIDGIMFGPHDYFNIYEYIKNRHNIPVYLYTELYGDMNDTIINLDIIPFFIPSFYIDQKYCIKLFNTIYPDNIIPKTKNIIKIGIDIRVKSRTFRNCDDFYAKFINDIYNHYGDKYQIIIHFTGVFKLNTAVDGDEANNQNIIVNNIIKNIDSNIVVENLILKDFSYIKDTVFNNNLNIASFGTCAFNLLNWIYNVKIITYGLKNWYKMVSDIQYDCLHNYNASVLPVDYIIETDDVNTFDIKYDLFYTYMLRHINYSLH